MRARAELARKPVGILLILLLIAGWAVLVASAAPLIEARAALAAHIVYYLVAGIVWILPLKPLLAGWRRGAGGRRARTGMDEMARVTGLEPATSGVTGRRSNQLSYTRVDVRRAR